MADFLKSINTARGNVPEVVSLRELGWRHDPGRALSTGLRQLDEMLGGEGLPVGRMSEFYGPASAGKTSLVSRIMAGVTARGGCAAYVDFFNVLSPEFLEAAGVDLENVLWVRGSGEGMSAEGPGLDDSGSGFDPDPAVGREQGPPGRMITAFRRAVKQVEILMQSGNFTLVVLDLAGPASGKGAANPDGSILPKGAWFRLQRAAEKSKSVLILLSGRRLTSGASARVLSLRGERRIWGGGKFPLGEGEVPARGMRGLEKHALLLGMDSGISVMKGGSHGRSIIFHCHL